MRTIALISFCVSGLFSTEAHTSEFNEAVKLSDVVGQSDVIVVAVPAEPPNRQIEVALAPREDGTPLPPFEYEVTRWVVHEVLLPDPRTLDRVGSRTMNEEPSRAGLEPRPPKAKDLIEVTSDTVSVRREVYERELRDGTRKFPVYESYQPTVQSRPTDRGARVLFLKLGDRGLIGIAGSASEGLGARSQVLKLLKNSKRI
jgi:hypothetical protein